MNSFQEFTKTRSLCGMALCLALGVVLNLLGSVYLSTNLKLSLVFLPLALCGMIYGMPAATVVGALTDVISFVIKPTGPYFPGFTLTTALTGLFFGLFLYKYKVKLWRIALSKVLVNLFLNIGLNGLWLYILYGTGFWALLPTRLLKNGLLLVPEVLLMWLILTPIAKHLKKEL